MAEKKSVATLQAENKRLARENRRLARELHTQSGQRRTSRIWRSIAIAFCVALAGGLLVAGNILFWAGQTVVNTDKYVATVTPLIENQQVQQGIASYTTAELYRNVDIQQVTADVLPPKAAFLAPTLSTQIQSYTDKVIQQILANPKFQDTWIEVQTKAHSTFIQGVRNYEGDGTIDINDVYQRISQRLTDTPLSFLANKQLPSNVGNITVITAQRLPAFHNLVVNIDLWQTLAVLALIIFTALAIWLSRNRRKMAIILGWTFAGLMLFTLVALRLSINQIANSVDPSYHDAVYQAAKIILNPLRIQTITLLLLGVLLASIAWVGGASKGAVAMRTRLQELLSGNLHRTLFTHENSLTNWVGAHRAGLQWAAVAITGIVFFWLTLSPAAVLWGALILLIVVLVIYVVAAPTSPSKR